jgi:hypothetical protein
MPRWGERGLMPGWGESWTDNKMFKLDEEKRRQQRVVKKFIADHPEYDPSNDANNKLLVDFVEDSKRPFTTDTIEWAYAHLKTFFNPKPKSFYQKISTALTNKSTSSVPLPEKIKDPIGYPANYTTIQGYKTIQMMGQNYNVPYYYDEVEAALNAEPAVDMPNSAKYDRDIAPTKTERRIKDDDD